MTKFGEIFFLLTKDFLKTWSLIIQNVGFTKGVVLTNTLMSLPN